MESELKILEAGHVYELRQLDAKPGDPPVILRFVNREPGHEHGGTQTQEVIRVIIDRTMHCDNCLRWPSNDLIIYHLRMALVLHEARALERKVEKGYIAPELITINPEDGHFAIGADPLQQSIDSVEYRCKPKPESPLVPRMPNFCKKS